jgi:hypothetical protein
MGNDGFARFFGRVTASHMVTYSVAGILAYTLLDYATAFESENLACYMKPTSSRWIVLGPAFQVIRGLVFAVALYGACSAVSGSCPPTGPRRVRSRG